LTQNIYPSLTTGYHPPLKKLLGSAKELGFFALGTIPVGTDKNFGKLKVR